MTVIQRLRLLLNGYSSWLFVTYLIFAGYLIFDTIIFAFDPSSGRKSSFSCTPQPPRKTICTVTIYGFLKTSQESFPADKFGGAELSWQQGSDYIPYGINIRAGSRKILFVYPNQGMDDRSVNPRLTQTINQINDLFENTPPSSTIISYDGVNQGLYLYLLRRGILLIIGFSIVLIYGRLKSSAAKRKINIVEPIKNTFARDLLSWWRINILVRCFFYLYFLATFISGVFLRFLSWEQINIEFSSYLCPGLQAFPESPLGSLFCLYPFMAFTTLQGYVQWHYLKQKFSISAWWIATPIFAVTPLLFIRAPALTCTDCRVFEWLPSGLYVANIGLLGTPGKFVFILFLIYSFLLGCAQWLILRDKLDFTAGWIFTPVINTTTLYGSGFLIQLIGLLINNVRQPPSSVLEGIFFSILGLLLTFGMQDIVSGLVITKILRANAVDKPKLLTTTSL